MLAMAFFTSTAILVFFTFLPLWRYEAWWVRSLDFPRLQLAIVSLILIILEVMLLHFSLFSSWVILTLTVSCFVCQAWWVAPYTLIFPVEVKSASVDDEKQRIRIITANVLTPNRNAEALIKLVKEHDPDVLVTLESDLWWQSKLDTLEDDYPYTVKCPLDNLYGMHVYSKLQMKNSQIKYLVEPDIPSIHTLVTLMSGQQIRMHFLHPVPPSPTQNEYSTGRDAELIIVAKSVADSEAPIIVTGDLNDVAWSETTRLFRKISGLLDPRLGRGMYNTYNAKYWFVRWPLDHLFHSSHFTLSRIQRLAGFGSDHFALFTELYFQRGELDNESILDADMDDLIWAQEKAEATIKSKHDVPEPEKK